MTTAETYVTAAFLVFLAVVLLWLVIYAFKMRRLEGELRELEAEAPSADTDRLGAPRVVPAHEAADAKPSADDSAERTAEPVR